MEQNQVTSEKVLAEERGLLWLPVSELYPHPDNPRKDVGDVSELAESIKAKGVMQNLTVVRGHYITDEEYQKLNAEYSNNPTEEIRELLNCAAHHRPVDGGYTVIIGHRRRAGALEAGLEAVPCVIVEMSYREQVATMLLENMQRVDLTAFEQAQGFQMMMDLGDTVESIAEKTGFSKKTVKHRLEMAKLNQKTLREVSDRQLTMEDFDKLSKIKSMEKRNEVLAKIGTYNFNNAVETALKEELIAERMPIFMEKVKALAAKEMKVEDRWSSKYEKIADVDVKVADADKPLIPKKYQSAPLFYAVRPVLGYLEIYRKRPKEEAKKRPKAEIEREKAIDECKKQLKAMTETARELRSNFARGIVMGAKNRDRVLDGAVAVLECGMVSYMYTTHQKTVLEFVGKETNDEYGKNEELFREAMREDPKRMIPAIIYLSFENDRNSKYYQEQYNDFPKHTANVWLDKCYDWLISLGYEMSDDEIALREGTCEWFRTEEKEKNE